MKKLYYLNCGKYRKLEKSKILYLLEITFFLLIAVSSRMKMKNDLKKKNQMKY